MPSYRAENPMTGDRRRIQASNMDGRPHQAMANPCALCSLFRLLHEELQVTANDQSWGSEPPPAAAAPTYDRRPSGHDCGYGRAAVRTGSLLAEAMAAFVATVACFTALCTQSASSPDTLPPGISLAAMAH